MNIDVRTGIEHRQGRAVTTAQVQDDNAVPLQLALAHNYILQLARPEAYFTTGATWDVNGGLLMR